MVISILCKINLSKPISLGFGSVIFFRLTGISVSVICNPPYTESTFQSVENGKMVLWPQGAIFLHIVVNSLKNASLSTETSYSQGNILTVNPGGSVIADSPPYMEVWKNC